MTRYKSALRPTQTPHGCFTQANLRSAASTRRSVTARAGTKRRVKLVPERVVGKNMYTSAGREVEGVGGGQLTQAAVQEQTSHESSHRHLAVSNVSLTMAHTRAQKTRSHPLRRHLGEV